jgi:hypothetical protein
MINNLLQKELQMRTVPTSTWVSNPDTTNNRGGLLNGKEWTVATKSNHKATLNKQERSENTVTERFTRNRFTRLPEIATDSEDPRCTIPVIVNEVISDKKRVKNQQTVISE